MHKVAVGAAPLQRAVRPFRPWKGAGRPLAQMLLPGVDRVWRRIGAVSWRHRSGLRTEPHRIAGDPQRLRHRVCRPLFPDSAQRDVAVRMKRQISREELRRARSLRVRYEGRYLEIAACVGKPPA